MGTVSQLMLDHAISSFRKVMILFKPPDTILNRVAIVEAGLTFSNLEADHERDQCTYQEDRGED